MSADNAGSKVVLPLVAHTKSLRTTVFVENHEPGPVRALLHYVGARGSSTPGLRKCPAGPVPFVLLPQSTTALDVATLCQLNGPDDYGTLTVLDLQKHVTARLSATARVDVLDAQGRAELGFSVDGIPLAYLEGTAGAHVVAGVRNGTSLSGFGTYRTDCYVGTFYDATSSGVVARLSVLDRDGQMLGSPVYAPLRPWELGRVEDVFRAAGVTGAFEQARVQIDWSGAGPSVLGYCLVVNGANRNAPSTSFHLAKALAPEAQTRQRDARASSTPTVTPAGGTFEFLPGTTLVRHVAFARHPDKLACAVDRGELLLTMVAPDASQTFGGNDNAVAEFDTGERSTIGSRSRGPGWADAWGLEVRWNPAFPPPSSPLAYSLRCEGGQGLSLLDQVFRN